MYRSKTIILGITLVLFVIILLQNTHEITLNILFWEINTTTFYIPIVIIVSVALGYYIAKFFEKKNKKKNDDIV